MPVPAGSLLPSSYFDALSELWGVTAYVAAAIAAAGITFSGWTNRNDPIALLLLLTKLFFVGLATVFLREWLMVFNDVVNAFGAVFGIDPTLVDDRFIHFLSGQSPTDPKVSVWDVIWHTGSVGTAIAYALLWLFGWLAYAVQFIVKLVGDILLSAGWSLSPIFLAFFLIRPMASVGLKYILGLVVLVCWPFGWVMASVVTNALLDRAAAVSLVPVVVPGGDPVGPVLTVLLIGLWMLLSSVLAPYVLYRVLMSGANPAAAFAQSLGGVAEAALIGGVGAGTAAVTGGATAPAAIAASAAGVMTASAESAARGGRFPTFAATAVGGAAGLYRGRFVMRQTQAMEAVADAQERRATASEQFSTDFAKQSQAAGRFTHFPNQPHTSDPNQKAIDIDSDAKS